MSSVIVFVSGVKFQYIQRCVGCMIYSSFNDGAVTFTLYTDAFFSMHFYDLRLFCSYCVFYMEFFCCNMKIIKLFYHHHCFSFH